jgi:hypothetical protein
VEQSRAVGDEHLIEEPALRGVGDLDVMIDVDAGIDDRAGMPPGGDVVSGCHDEGTEAELTTAHRDGPAGGLMPSGSTKRAERTPMAIPSPPAALRSLLQSPPHTTGCC